MRPSLAQLSSLASHQFVLCILQSNHTKLFPFLKLPCHCTCWPYCEECFPSLSTNKFYSFFKILLQHHFLCEVFPDPLTVITAIASSITPQIYICISIIALLVMHYNHLCMPVPPTKCEPLENQNKWFPSRTYSINMEFRVLILPFASWENTQ